MWITHYLGERNKSIQDRQGTSQGIDSMEKVV